MPVNVLNTPNLASLGRMNAAKERFVRSLSTQAKKRLKKARVFIETMTAILIYFALALLFNWIAVIVYRSRPEKLEEIMRWRAFASRALWCLLMIAWVIFRARRALIQGYRTSIANLVVYVLSLSAVQNHIAQLIDALTPIRSTRPNATVAATPRTDNASLASEVNSLPTVQPINAEGEQTRFKTPIYDNSTEQKAETKAAQADATAIQEAKVQAEADRIIIQQAKVAAEASAAAIQAAKVQAEANGLTILQADFTATEVNRMTIQQAKVAAEAGAAAIQNAKAKVEADAAAMLSNTAKIIAAIQKAQAEAEAYATATQTAAATLACLITRIAVVSATIESLGLEGPASISKLEDELKVVETLAAATQDAHVKTRIYAVTKQAVQDKVITPEQAKALRQQAEAELLTSRGAEAMAKIEQLTPQEREALIQQAAANMRAQQEADREAETEAAAAKQEAERKAFGVFFSRRTIFMARVTRPMHPTARMQCEIKTSNKATIQARVMLAPNAPWTKENFEHVFDAASTNEEVFRVVKPIAMNMADGSGQHMCIGVDGFSGSGKSHTIEGLVSSIGAYLFQFRHPLTEVVFEAFQSTGVDVDSLDIHIPADVKDKVERTDFDNQFREKSSCFSESRPCYTITSASGLAFMIRETARFRANSQTNNNATSSRTHLVILIYAQHSPSNPANMLCLFDLAGNERSDALEGISGASGEEGSTAKINESRVEIHSALRAALSRATRVNRGTAVGTFLKLFVVDKEAYLTLIFHLSEYSCFSAAILKTISDVRSLKRARGKGRISMTCATSPCEYLTGLSTVSPSPSSEMAPSEAAAKPSQSGGHLWGRAPVSGRAASPSHAIM